MEKADIINIFDAISGRYDLANTLLSAGVEKLWRRQFLKRFTGCENTVIDVCCGTGISSYGIYSKLCAEKRNSDRRGSSDINATGNPSGCNAEIKTGFIADPNAGLKRNHSISVYGVDFSRAMINVARKNYRGISHLKFENGDATDLNFGDNFFDCISIVFGIRNILDRDGALKEFYRVIKPGGKLLVMEFGYINRGIFARFYNFYLQKILPKIGGLLTGNKDAYRYLIESIREFPGPERFIRMMESAGWKNCSVNPGTFGACNIFTGFKIL